MAAKGRALSIVLAIAAIFASSPAFASIPRSTILDPAPAIDLGARSEEPRPFRDPAQAIDESIDNAELLHHAIDGALATPAPVESLSESRVWVSRLERPLIVEPISPLTHALHRGSVAAWPEIASDPTVLTPDPSGYADSSNLYAFAGGDPVNGRDPSGELCEKGNADGWWDRLKRCSEDLALVQQEFSEGIILHPVKTTGRAVAGFVGTGKMIAKSAVGVGAMVVDQQLAQGGDVDAMMRQGQRVMGIANAVRHPINTVVDAHTRAAKNILAAEQSGHWFQASVEAGEIGSADAAAIAGATEMGIGLARAGTRLLTRTAVVESGAAGVDVVVEAPAATGPSGEIYSVIYQTELRTTSYPGLSRAAHFQEANEALLTSMELNPEFAAAMRQAGVNLERTPTGLAPRTSPSGWTWHHAQEPGVMQLVPRPQHTAGSIFWDALHRGRIGGYAIWGK